MVVGIDDEVGVSVGFNRSAITGLLRDRHELDKAEHLSTRERMLAVLNAGADQFGGEAILEVPVDLVRSGEPSEERIDVPAQRLLREKLVLGLFDPLVDVERAESVVGSIEFRDAGEAAQRVSFTLPTTRPNPAGAPTLPLPRSIQVCLRGVSAEAAAG